MRAIGLRDWLRLAGLCVLGGYQLALAQTSETRVAWTCWYGGDTSVLCQLAQTPQGSETAPKAMPPTDQSAKTAHGQPASLPTYVRLIRDAPEQLTGQTIFIPLHSVPIDMAHVGELAQSAMCGHNPQCAVVFGRSYAEAVGKLARL